MESTAVIALTVAGAVVLAIVFFLWIPVTGWAPKRILQIWTHFMRALKCGDQYAWNWTKASPFRDRPSELLECPQVEDGLYIGTMPRVETDLSELQEEGISAIVTLNEEWELLVPPANTEGMGFTQLVLGVPDYSAPSLRKIQRSVDWAMEATYRGEGVYVHCNAGKGRSCVVVVCILMMRFGMDALQAYKHVAELRDVSLSPALCETKPQWRVVRAYERYLSEHQHGTDVGCEVNPLPGVGIIAGGLQIDIQDAPLQSGFQEDDRLNGEETPLSPQMSPSVGVPMQLQKHD